MERVVSYLLNFVVEKQPLIGGLLSHFQVMIPDSNYQTLLNAATNSGQFNEIKCFGISRQAI